MVTYLKKLCWSRVFYENFINIANVSWENFKPFWRLQNYLSREEDVHVHSPSIYGQIVRWRKTINEMGGNIAGGNFLGGNFPGGSLMGGNLPGGNFPGGIFLELYETMFFDMWKYIYSESLSNTPYPKTDQETNFLNL